MVAYGYGKCCREEQQQQQPQPQQPRDPLSYSILRR
jgi:hypothetical protein